MLTPRQSTARPRPLESYSVVLKVSRYCATSTNDRFTLKSWRYT
jgi:hypothetical protein